MKTIWLVLVLALLSLAFTGCATKDTGSREFRPGQGWVPT